MVRRLVRFILVLGIACSISVHSQAQPDFQKAHELLSRIQKDRLNSRTAKERSQLAQEIRVVLPRVQELIAKGILDLLNSGKPVSTADLEQQISAALQVGPNEPGNAAQVFVLPVGLTPGRHYIVGYNIAYCAVCSQAWMAAFKQTNGYFSIVAIARDFLPNQSLAAVPIWIGSNDMRFLVYGTHWGDTENRLNIVAYTLKNNEFQETWSRMDLPEGSLEAKPGSIIVSYIVGTRSPQHEKREIYTVTADSINLKNSSETPLR